MLSKPELIDDIQKVLKESWSLWAQILGIFLLLGTEVLYVLTGIDYDPRINGILGLGLLVIGVVGRIFKQRKGVLNSWTKLAISILLVFMLSVVVVKAETVNPCPNPGIASAEDTLAIAVPLVAKWEGVRLNAYRDIVGVPTICYGSTRGVRMGMRKTKQECLALLRSEVAEYRIWTQKGFTQDTLRCRLPPTRDAAFTDLGYNVGPPAVHKSTATRRLNSGDIPGACTAIGWYNRAGKKIVRGLVLRRGDDVSLCRQ